MKKQLVLLLTTILLIACQVTSLTPATVSNVSPTTYKYARHIVLEHHHIRMFQIEGSRSEDLLK